MKQLVLSSDYIHISWTSTEVFISAHIIGVGGEMHLSWSHNTDFIKWLDDYSDFYMPIWDNDFICYTERYNKELHDKIDKIKSIRLILNT